MIPEEKSVNIVSHLWRYNELGQAEIIAQAIREAVAEEREACAQIADEWDKGEENEYNTTRRVCKGTAAIIAYTIRARANAEDHD